MWEFIFLEKEQCQMWELIFLLCFGLLFFSYFFLFFSFFFVANCFLFYPDN